MTFTRSLVRLEDLTCEIASVLTEYLPQKAILHSCIKWQEAVLEQLEAALLRYPHHIEGEHYLMLNLLGSAQSLAAHPITTARNWELSPSDTGSVKPVAGSPFHGGDRLVRGNTGT